MTEKDQDLTSPMAENDTDMTQNESIQPVSEPKTDENALENDTDVSQNETIASDSVEKWAEIVENAGKISGKPVETDENPVKTTVETPPESPKDEVPTPKDTESVPTNKVQLHFVPPTKPMANTSRIIEGRKGRERVPFDAVKDDSK